jgi:hypothetical protein
MRKTRSKIELFHFLVVTTFPPLSSFLHFFEMITYLLMIQTYIYIYIYIYINMGTRQTYIYIRDIEHDTFYPLQLGKFQVTLTQRKIPRHEKSIVHTIHSLPHEQHQWTACDSIAHPVLFVWN